MGDRKKKGGVIRTVVKGGVGISSGRKSGEGLCLAESTAVCKSNEPGLQMSYRYSGIGGCDLGDGLGGRGYEESSSLASVLICAQQCLLKTHRKWFWLQIT